MEIEARWTDVDHEMIRKRLILLGGRRSGPMEAMTRSLWDFAGGELARSRGWLRLRKSADHVTLTYKQSRGRKLGGTLEREVVVSDYQTTCEILQYIGLKKRSVQESRREVWQLADVEIDLDEWPWLPPFVELEGPTAAAVRSVANSLGFDMERAEFGSVDESYADHYDIDPGAVIALSRLQFGVKPPLFASRDGKSGRQAH
jgi:adenylate cyclase class 2